VFLSEAAEMAFSFLKTFKHFRIKNVPIFDFPISHLYLAPPFIVEDYEPVALKTHREGLLRPKVDAALQELESCKVCPRNCAVNRLNNQVRPLKSAALDEFEVTNFMRIFPRGNVSVC